MNKLALAASWLLVLLLLSGCAAPSASSQPAASGPVVQLSVFAAASLTEAFSEIGAEFQADRPGLAAEFNFAGSQNLAQQINQGAAADVFASAHQQQMEAAIRSGRVQAGAVRTFAQNRPVVVLPQDNPSGLVSLTDLARPGLRLAAAGIAFDITFRHPRDIIIILLLGTPLAYLMGRHKYRLKRLLDALIDLPALLPPSVAGVALLLTFGRRGAIGSWLEGAGVQIAFTLSVILVLVSLTAILLVKGFITTW